MSEGVPQISTYRIPFGGCLIVTSVGLFVLAIIAIIDYQRFDPLYQPLKCTNVFMQVPMEEIGGAEVVIENEAPALHRSFTIAMGGPEESYGLLQGSRNQAAEELIVQKVLSTLEGLPAILKAMNPAYKDMSLEQIDAAIKADMTVYQKLFQDTYAALTPEQKSGMINAALGYQRGYVNGMVPVEKLQNEGLPKTQKMKCVNPNEFSVTVHADGTEGRIFAYIDLDDATHLGGKNGPNPGAFVEIGSITADHTVELEKDVETSVSLGMKMQLSGPAANWFNSKLSPPEGPKGVAPIFFSLNPLRTTVTAVVMGITEKEENPVPEHYCAVLVKKHDIPDPKDKTKTKEFLFVNSPTICRHTRDEVKDIVLKQDFLDKYGAHSPVDPEKRLADVPTAEEQTSAGYADKMEADHQRIDDVDEKLKMGYYGLMGFGFGFGSLCMVIGAFLIHSGLKQKEAIRRLTFHAKKSISMGLNANGNNMNDAEVIVDTPEKKNTAISVGVVVGDRDSMAL